MVFMPTGRLLDSLKSTSMILGLCAYLELFNPTHRKAAAGHDELQARQRQEAIAEAQL